MERANGPFGVNYAYYHCSSPWLVETVYSSSAPLYPGCCDLVTLLVSAGHAEIINNLLVGE